MTEQLRLQGTYGGHLVQLLKQGYLELVAQGHVQMAYKYLQGGKFHISQCLVTLTVKKKKVLPDAQREPTMFQFVPVASVFLAPSLQVFIDINEISPSFPFFRLNSTSCLSFYS